MIYYISSMKIKTSITLSEDVLKAIDSMIGEHKNRSDFIETAVRTFIIQTEREKQNQRDLELINQHADRLNEEASEVLTFQVAI